jgi:CHAT domain-containing protein
LKHARADAYSKMLPEIQSQLSDLYRVAGNLPKAEELARAAAVSAQAAGYTPLIPPLLDGVAQIEIAEQRYRDADRTYDRAAAIQDMLVGNANSAFGKIALITGASDLYAKHFALLTDHFSDPAKAFAVIEQARGRVMTDLLLSGTKTSTESLRTENEISRLRLKLTAAQSDRQVRELRDAIFVAEQRPLHLVPFDALMDGANHHLVESRIVTYAPSASGFWLLRSRRQRNTIAQGVLAVGGVEYDRSGLKAANVVRGYNPDRLTNLPNSEEEARIAAAELPSPANTLLLGARATEWAFKKAVNHRIVHLAVHAVANEVYPERAAVILLSDPAKGEDGFLQASEIAQLPLDADLVVLSACDTAVGPVEGQEGIANLSKGFLLAGGRGR